MLRVFKTHLKCTLRGLMVGYLYFKEERRKNQTTKIHQTKRYEKKNVK